MDPGRRARRSRSATWPNRWPARRDGCRGAAGERSATARRPRARRRCGTRWPLMALLGQHDAAAALRARPRPPPRRPTRSRSGRRGSGVSGSSRWWIRSRPRPTTGSTCSQVFDGVGHRAPARGRSTCRPAGGCCRSRCVGTALARRCCGRSTHGTTLALRRAGPACAAARRVVGGAGTPGRRAVACLASIHADRVRHRRAHGCHRRLRGAPGGGRSRRRRSTTRRAVAGDRPDSGGAGRIRRRGDRCRDVLDRHRGLDRREQGARDPRRRSAPTGRPPRVRAGGTTPTCWRWACG